jgi:O-acetyl-ADP-ribose deacetylase (regulator of RNase III)
VNTEMPLKYVEGNILDASTQVVVNTVNCKGVMGKGLALQFKKKYPEMYKEYKEKCGEGRIVIGKLDLYQGTPRYWILNFPTKNHWRNKSKLEYIEKGLLEFKDKYQEWGITSIAFPRLGCQQGGLNWTVVKTLMERYLAGLHGLDVEIFSFKPTVKKPAGKGKRRRTPSVGEHTIQKQLKLTHYSNKDSEHNAT